MKIMTIAEFLTWLNLDLIEEQDEDVFLDMDIFEYLMMLGVVKYVDEE